MKFTCTVDIKLPRDQVVDLWQNPDNLDKWQDGFKGVEFTSGPPGEVGSKCILKYDMGRTQFDLEETILVNDLPDVFKGRYDMENMTNTMHNRFEEVETGVTRWTADLDYTIHKGFVVKLLSKIWPGMFKRQTQKWLNQFRDFAENTGPT